MDQPVLDFVDARNRMVDSQVRPNKVTDPRILSAMRRLPREAFLPPALAPRAYGDDDVKLGAGRVLMAPMSLARLIQLGAPRAGERALVVAAGTGYGAAVLAACGPRVVALEDDPALRARAADALAAHAPSVEVIAGPPGAGWPAGAPYDLILIEGAVTDIPPALVGQLRDGGGRLVAVRIEGGIGQAVLGESLGGILRTRPAFDCATALVPALRPAPVFTF